MWVAPSFGGCCFFHSHAHTHGEPLPRAAAGHVEHVALHHETHTDARRSFSHVGAQKVDRVGKNLLESEVNEAGKRLWPLRRRREEPYVVEHFA